MVLRVLYHLKIIVKILKRTEIISISIIGDPNYFSSLSEEQLNGDDYRYLIGIKHLIGDPLFPLKILEREMSIIEKDYRETLFFELKKNKNITFIDYSQKAENTNWFLDYSHFSEFAASKLSSKLAEDILQTK